MSRLVLEPDPKNPEFYRLTVQSHLWAWSIRTTGFPVYALKADGSAVLIGSTSKRQQTYMVPADAVAIVRTYITTLCNHAFYVLPLDSKAEYEVRGVCGYDTSRLPQQVREPFARFLRSYLAGDP